MDSTGEVFRPTLLDDERYRPTLGASGTSARKGPSTSFPSWPPTSGHVHSRMGRHACMQANCLPTMGEAKFHKGMEPIFSNRACLCVSVAPADWGATVRWRLLGVRRTCSKWCEKTVPAPVHDGGHCAHSPSTTGRPNQIASPRVLSKPPDATVATCRHPRAPRKVGGLDLRPVVHPLPWHIPMCPAWSREVVADTRTQPRLAC